MELLRTCPVLGIRDTVVDTRAGNLEFWWILSNQQ